MRKTMGYIYISWDLRKYSVANFLLGVIVNMVKCCQPFYMCLLLLLFWLFRLEKHGCCFFNPPKRVYVITNALNLVVSI